MKINNYEEFQRKSYHFKINKSFNTRTELSPRILEISEAFGLGVSELKKFSVFEDFYIGFNKGEIIYITGDSGGGKSILLKELNKRLMMEGSRIFLSSIIPNPEDVIVESIGKTTEEAVRLLSVMGLNDAFIFLRKYKELSDGQKYRYRLAKMLETGMDFYFIDEFCAKLDRITAKVIAYNLQKVVRRTGVTLFIATTHLDLITDLNPDILVTKNYMDKVKIEYLTHEKRKISFYNKVKIERGVIDDYKKLAKFHYKNPSTDFPYSRIYCARMGTELVGTCVYSPPFLQTKGRTIKFDGKYSLMKKEVVAEINKLFIRCSRIVISPKFRGCGLGQKLLLESMKLQKDKKYVELINIMGKYNPFADRVGMEKIEISEETDAPTIALDKWLCEKGLKTDEIHNPVYWRQFVESLSPADKITLTRMTGKVLHHPKIGLSSKEGKRAEVVRKEKIYKEVDFNTVKEEIIDYVPKLYSGHTLYYIWINPDYQEKKMKTIEEWF